MDFDRNIFAKHLTNHRNVDPNISFSEVLEFAADVWSMAQQISPTGNLPTFMMAILSRVIRGDPLSVLPDSDVKESAR